MNCKQYQEFINKDAETNADANRTKTMLLVRYFFINILFPDT